METIKTTTSPPVTPARRHFLALLSGGVAATATTALPAIAATTAPAVTEAPELLAIGARLPDLVTRLRAAKLGLDEAVAAYERLKPAIPPEIIAPRGESRDLTEMERGHDGQPVRHLDSDRVFWNLYSSRKVKAHIILNEIPARTKEGRRVRRIVRLAAKYEKDHKAAIEASGYSKANSAIWDLRIELQDDFAKAALAIKPVTMKGLAVYAAIIIAGNGPAKHDGRAVGGCDDLGLAMAEFLAAPDGGGAQ